MSGASRSEPHLLHLLHWIHLIPLAINEPKARPTHQVACAAEKKAP
jgi:hypothetical protein